MLAGVKPWLRSIAIKEENVKYLDCLEYLAYLEYLMDEEEKIPHAEKKALENCVYLISFEKDH